MSHIIATHIDTDHIHSHIIFNEVNMVTGKTFHTEKNRGGKVYWAIRKMSDEICEEMGLSVLEPNNLKGKSYYEWLMYHQGRSYKGKLKILMDRIIKSAKSFDDFIEQLRQAGVEVKLEDCKPIKYRYTAVGQKNFANDTTLGNYYSEETIKRRIEKRRGSKSKFAKEQDLASIIDTSQDKFAKSTELEHWAKIQNLKNAAKMISYFSEQGVSSDKEIDEKTFELHEQNESSIEKLKETEEKIKQYAYLKKQLLVKREYAELYYQYKTVKDTNSFFMKHEKEILMYEEAFEFLKSKLGRKLPTVEQVEKELTKVEQERDILVKQIGKGRSTVYKLEKYQEQIKKYLEAQDQSDRAKVKNKNNRDK